MRFTWGKTVTTRAVFERTQDDPAFAELVQASILRHANGDWGNVCRSDKDSNERNVDNKGMVLSAYTIDPEKGDSDHGDNTLWIITDPGHEVTTVLFPDEY